MRQVRLSICTLELLVKPLPVVDVMSFSLRSSAYMRPVSRSLDDGY